MARFCKDGRKCEQGLYAGIPALFVGFGCDFLRRQIAARSEPVVGLSDFRWIGGSGEDGGDELIRVERNWRNKLLKLFGIFLLIQSLGGGLTGSRRCAGCWRRRRLLSSLIL